MRDEGKGVFVGGGFNQWEKRGEESWSEWLRRYQPMGGVLVGVA
jgi:hypothetical protein